MTTSESIRAINEINDAIKMMKFNINRYPSLKVHFMKCYIQKIRHICDGACIDFNKIKYKWKNI